MKKLILVLFFLAHVGFLKAQLYNNYKLTYSQSVVPAATIDDDFYFRVREMRDREIEELIRIRNEETRIQNEEKARIRAEQAEKAKAETNIRLSRVKEIFATVKKFPASYPDGWYNVVSTNNLDFCLDRKVYLEKQRVVKYVTEKEEELIVLFSSKVTDGKVILKHANLPNDYLDLYFLEYILQ